MQDSYKVMVAPYDSDLWDECRRIRIEVFVDEQGYKLEEEIDEYDKECLHLLLLRKSEDSVTKAMSGPSMEASGSTTSLSIARANGYRPAGTLRYFGPPKSKVGRVAVDKKHRGKGLGGYMMKGLEALLKGELEDSPTFPGGKATEICLSAQGMRAL